MKQKYTVDLVHPNDPEGRWSGTKTFETSDYWDADRGPLHYAVAAEFGCGRNSKTPERAILSLAMDNGATVLSITKEEDQ